MRLTRIGVLSAAKITGVLYALIGVFLIPFFLLVGAFSMLAGKPEAGFGNVVIAFFMPILYGGLGFVGGALMAWLFNVIAGWLGGLELELTPDEAARPAVPAAPMTPPAAPIEPA